MICPIHCVCQFAHRMDLSISRWVHSVETRQKRGYESESTEINSNEVKIKLQTIKKSYLNMNIVPFKIVSHFFLLLAQSVGQHE
jgi:hypothetical protein